jgi:hypothetical protein
VRKQKTQIDRNVDENVPSHPAGNDFGAPLRTSITSAQSRRRPWPVADDSEPGGARINRLLLNIDLPRPHSTIRLHLSHERERHFVLAISDMREKVGAGIIIEFEEAIAGFVLKFHTNAELPFGRL